MIIYYLIYYIQLLKFYILICNFIYYYNFVLYSYIIYHSYYNFILLLFSFVFKRNLLKYLLIEDIDSGLNFNRRGLRKIIKYAINC